MGERCWRGSKKVIRAVVEQTATTPTSLAIARRRAKDAWRGLVGHTRITTGGTDGSEEHLCPINAQVVKSAAHLNNL